VSTNQRGFVQQVWDFFCSLKLTIFLLITLAITSIIGTIIPQYPNIDERYWATISAGRKAFYEKLDFFDMYHSWWFLALLALFSVNLISCSIKRLPHVFTFVSEPATTISETQQKIFSSKEVKLQSTSLEDARDKLAAFLGKRFSAPVSTQVGNQYHLFAQKNAWCRLGVYVVHFSILVIMAGTIIGNIWGYKGFAAIVEGETITSVKARNGQDVPLGFEVKCDQFTVSFYDAPGGGGPTQMPKEFKSILTLTENGKEIPGYKHARVIVNEPLTYKGITFYQSSYGQANDPSTFFFTVRQREGGKIEQLALRPGTQTRLPDGRSVSIVDLTENPGEGLAAVLGLSDKGGEPKFFKVFKNNPGLDELRGDSVIFAFTGTDARMYTGLQVNKDPGVWVVWTGCIMMCLGLCIAFFMSHKRVWIVVQHGYARIYGNASKNQPGFLNEFEALADELQKQNI
jgi:cytochrome c biogenesis protein